MELCHTNEEMKNEREDAQKEGKKHARTGKQPDTHARTHNSTWIQTCGDLRREDMILMENIG